MTRELRKLNQFVLWLDVAYSKMVKRTTGKEQDHIWYLDLQRQQGTASKEITHALGARDEAQKTYHFNNVKHVPTVSGSNLASL